MNASCPCSASATTFTCPFMLRFMLWFMLSFMLWFQQDTEDRNFGPVLLESGGAVDLLTPCMDHGWCFGYTCQKRLSTYWATVAANQVSTQA